MLIKAKVKHRVKGNDFSASAQVGFASGPVMVDLKRVGRSFVARVRVPVAEDEALGEVPVEVTITYGGVAQPVIPVTGRVVAADDDGDD